MILICQNQSYVLRPFCNQTQILKVHSEQRRPIAMNCSETGYSEEAVNMKGRPVNCPADMNHSKEQQERAIARIYGHGVEVKFFWVAP